MADLEGLSAGHLGEGDWQLITTRHGRALDQRWNHSDIAFKRGLNLQADQILLVIKPAPAGVVSPGQPVLPDHGYQEVARADCLVVHFSEVRSRLNGVDVHEDSPNAETGAQGVM